MIVVIVVEVGKLCIMYFYVWMLIDDMFCVVVMMDLGGYYIDVCGWIVVCEDNGWIEFVIGLYEYFYFLMMLGLIVVGVLGVVLVVFVLIGVFVYFCIICDVF